MAKKGQMGLVIGILAIAIIAGLVFVGMSGTGLFAQTQGGTIRGSCDGIASVNGLYNDIDRFRAGTDPDENISIYSANGEPYQKAIDDDATSTTVPVNSDLKGLAGNEFGVISDTYFGEEVSFTTDCVDTDIQPKLTPASAPTLTGLNDDGITKNSISNYEDVGASTEYTWEISLRAPTDACASHYGAVLACEYDSTYVNKMEAGAGLTNSQQGILSTHSNSSLNQWVAFNYAPELCDGAKDDISIVYETTAAAGADSVHMNCSWYGINKDLNADELTVITGIYDEDNNEIHLAETWLEHYII